MFTYCQSFPNFRNNQIVIGITVSSPENGTSSILESYLLSINICSIWLWVCPTGEVQLYLWMFRCRYIVLLTTRSSDVANFTALTPLSHLNWYLTSQLSVQGEEGCASRYGAGGVGLSGQEGGWAFFCFLMRDEVRYNLNVTWVELDLFWS